MKIPTLLANFYQFRLKTNNKNGHIHTYISSHITFGT